MKKTTKLPPVSLADDILRAVRGDVEAAYRVGRVIGLYRAQFQALPSGSAPVVRAFVRR